MIDGDNILLAVKLGFKTLVALLKFNVSLHILANILAIHIVIWIK